MSIDFGEIRSQSERDDYDLAAILLDGCPQGIGYFLEKKNPSKLERMMAVMGAVEGLTKQEFANMLGWTNAIIALDGVGVQAYDQDGPQRYRISYDPLDWAYVQFYEVHHKLASIIRALIPGRGGAFYIDKEGKVHELRNR